MTDEDKELARRIREKIRRKYYRPPNPDDVTEWAYQVCVENWLTENQLYSWLLDKGECFSSAYRMVYGPMPHEIYGDDWKSLIDYLRKRFGWTHEELANYVRGWYDSQNASTVRRALDPDAREKQRRHDRDYWARLQQDEDRYQRRLAAMREYSREHYRRKKDT